MNTPIFEENDLEHFKGIDIMRAVRSFDPCLPCGVHMYLGKGKVLKKLHSPTQVADTRTGLLTDRTPEAHRCAPQNLRAVGDRIEQLLDELHAVADPRALADRRGAAAVRSPSSTAAGSARVVELVGEDAPAFDRRAGRRRAGRQPAGRRTGCTPTASRRASSGRSSRCGRSSPSTAATSSCSTSTATPARCSCACSAAATAARRRR